MNKKIQKKINSIEKLNLARKWRPKNFDEVVGQDLSVKILKNSLYLERFFPVYLFSGQRGCGKTTMARIFAAAINCEHLEEFKKNPKKQVLPCNNCTSCKAMQENKHPDFIEMDAASHTGVDNVRNIIDAASLCPAMGNKKIYLIDEAHMLSKAAFNAFLKILEEPPPSVVFILATTDIDKIIDTVKSRCFQLFFSAIAAIPLLEHLQHICEKESIKAEKDALAMVVKESQGSARDAINMLERVRFSAAIITLKNLRLLLGHIEDKEIFLLLSFVCKGAIVEVLNYCIRMQQQGVKAEYLWYRFLDILRAAIWVKHGVKPQQFQDYENDFKQLLIKISWLRINAMMHAMCSNEQFFKKTVAQYAFFEMILLEFCQKNQNNLVSNEDPNLESLSMSSVENVQEAVEDNEDEESEEEEALEEWKQCLQEVHGLNEPLLYSVFKQATCIDERTEKKKISIACPKELAFFKEQVTQLGELWKPIFEKEFGNETIFSIDFCLEKKIIEKVENKNNADKEVASVESFVASKPVKSLAPVAVKNYSAASSRQSYSKNTVQKEKKLKRISNKNLIEFPQVQTVLRHFPGDVYEECES